MNKETKQESSIPVQSRVSIVTLAQLVHYWESNGSRIKTVSQLISWSLYLLVDALIANEQLKGEPTIAEARHYMIEKELFQQSTVDRGMKKLDAAIRFQIMRENGIYPTKGESRKGMRKSNDEVTYSKMHRAPNKFDGSPSSVEPWVGSVEHPRLNEAIEIFNSIKDEDLGKTELTEGLNRLVVRNKMTIEEAAEVIKANEEIAQRDLDALNSLDLSTLSPVTEDK